MLILATLVSSFFFTATSDVRTSYVSLGKLMEDRAMQYNFVHAGVGAGAWGRFGIGDLEISSLTDRRNDVHEHGFYHSAPEVFWTHSLELAEGWKYRGKLTRGWTIYRRFDNPDSNHTYSFWMYEPSLENPYLTPFARLRRAFTCRDYFYFRAGVSHRFALGESFYLTPSVSIDGGNGRLMKRNYGRNACASHWGSGGVGDIVPRLEVGWKIREGVTLYAFVEQYEVVGHDARRSVDASTNRCLHNDWTLGGIGFRLKF